MSLSVNPEAERILILDDQEQSCFDTRNAVVQQLPSAVVEAVRSVEDLRKVLDTASFDIVLLDQKATDTHTVELLHELRMREEEPSVLVVSASADPTTIAEIYNHGCQRCIVKEGDWQRTLGPTIRQAMRYRKIQAQNQDLQARIVEANILLEEKNRRLDEFGLTIAHDIRGPLAGLSMKLDFILSQYGAQFDQRCNQLLTNGLHSVERLTQLVQGMYEYARIGAKAEQMEMVPLESLVREVVTDLLVEPSKELQVGIAELPTVWGNKELLRQLFLNLISNSIKYNDSPELVINIGAVAFTSESLGEMAEISVSDNGRGIPSNEIEHVFRMFQRGSSARGDKEGAGLGLAVVRRIVELHFGKIRVESNQGAGSCFIMSLPLHKIDLLR